MDSFCSESDNSESIIPSSNFEPPPPVDYILSKAQTCDILTDSSLNRKASNISDSQIYTQQDDFEDIPYLLSNQVADCNYLDSSRGLLFYTPRSSLMEHSIHSALSSEILNNGANNSKEANQLNKMPSELGAQTSNPLKFVSKYIPSPSAAPLASMEKTNLCLMESLASGSTDAIVANTTSNCTTRSSSDLFKSDSSAFSKPIVPPKKWSTSVPTSTATADKEVSPAFSCTLALSVLRHSSIFETTEHVEFKIPDFVKTVTWQSRVRRMDEQAAAAVSEAAVVLADSYGDWLRQLLISDSEVSQSAYNRTPATVIAQQEAISNVRISSSSSEYFFPRKTNILEKTPGTSNQAPHDITSKSAGNVICEILSKDSKHPSDPNITASEGKLVITSSPATNLDKKPRSSISSDSQDKSNLESGENGALVYTKWNRNMFFYSSQITGASTDDRYRVLFDDKSRVTVNGSNILLVELLPIGALVYADVSGSGEYEAGYLILDHVVAASAPSYIIERIENNEIFRLERQRVAIHSDDVEALIAANRVKRAKNQSDISLLTSDRSPSVSIPKRHSTRVRSSKIAISDVSATRSSRRKRAMTELKRTVEHSVSTQRLIRTRTTPQQLKLVSSTSVLSSDSYDSPRFVKQRRTRLAGKANSQRHKSQKRSNGLSRRESQIWAFGRRVVAQASRASRRFSSTLLSSSPSGKVPSVRRSSEKRQKLSCIPNKSVALASPAPTIDEPIARQDLTPTVTPTLPRLLNEFHVTVQDQLECAVDTEEFKRICRKYRIPFPHPDLFSKWCIVRTTGVKTKDSEGIQITSNPESSRQFSLCENANFLRLLISVGGGQNLDTIEADYVSSTGQLATGELGNIASKASRPHIVLVAPSAKRTVKFLQGLATLGRVPLVHPVWLLDACLLAAGKKPIIAASDVASRIVALHTDQADIPMELLRRSDRTLYELPRGVDKITNKPVLPDTVPALFTEQLNNPKVKTLTELGGYNSARMIAIVTNDIRGFGEGWLSILRNAMCTASGAPRDDETPSVIASSESADRLKAWKTMGNASAFDTNIVLVDQERIPEFVVSDIKSMGFTVINKEFLIQSLIHGKMLDLKYTTTWNP